METSVKDLELTDEEFRVIGTHNDIFEANTRFKVIYDSETLFSSQSYTLNFDFAYSRFVPFNCKTVLKKVKDYSYKMTDEASGFHPTFASKSVKMNSASRYFVSHLEQLQENMCKELELEFVDKENVILRVKDPSKNLIITDLLPHNCGLNFSVIQPAV